MQFVSTSTARNLADKAVEKRRLGAQDIEHVARNLKQRNDEANLRLLISDLTDQFACNIQANARKGGLLAFAAIAVAIGTQDIHDFLDFLVPPVFGCLKDQDSKVRFHACEALYNVSKVATEKMFRFFPDIFDGLGRLSADSDQQVQRASELLDRLVKDIATSSDVFDLDNFVVLLRDRIMATNPFVRTFLVSWIDVVHSIPGTSLVPFLPDFLGGVFRMLSAEQEPIRLQVEKVLDSLLRETSDDPDADHRQLIQIVIPFVGHRDNLTCSTSMAWVRMCLSVADERLLEYIPSLLERLLPCVAHASDSIRDIAADVNQQIHQIVAQTTLDVYIGSILHVASVELAKHDVATRIASLHWILMLFEKLPESTLEHIDELFPLLLLCLNDRNDMVVTLDLEVLARFSRFNHVFVRFMQSLVQLFSSDHQLLSRASLIMRTLCVMLSPRDVYVEISKILVSEEDLDFASVIVQSLNMILMTSGELESLRRELQLTQSNQNSRILFETLYRSWIHNPIAALCLCFLSQSYEHAAELVLRFTEFEMTVDFLVQTDELVQLLESPVFTFLRIQLLQPSRQPHLVRALHGILMLLPQSTAFETLRNRLAGVSTLALLDMFTMQNRMQPDPSKCPINYASMLQDFSDLQKRHTSYRMDAESSTSL